MNDDKLLVDWFGRRKQSIVMKGIRSHASKVLATLSELDIAISAAGSGNEKEASAALDRLLLSEREADNLEKMISEELSKGDLNPRQREDLLDLIREMDRAADWAKEACMNLRLLLEAGIEVSEEIWDQLKEMTRILTDIGKQLKGSIDSLGGDHSKIISYGKEVGRLEEVLDDKYFQVKKHVIDGKLESRGLILVKDILNSIENAADNCEDAGDIIHIIHFAEQHEESES